MEDFSGFWMGWETGEVQLLLREELHRGAATLRPTGLLWWQEQHQRGLHAAETDSPQHINFILEL